MIGRKKEFFVQFREDKKLIVWMNNRDKQEMKNLKKLLLFKILLLTASPLFGESYLYSHSEFHGMAEARGGLRISDDETHKSRSAGDLRLRGEIFFYPENFEFKFTPDFCMDNIKNKSELKTREAWIFLRPFENIDIKAGRQILTWGTGDLVFLNDLFPKDWQSFFIGRDDQYLKAPSDSIKIGLFTDLFSIDFIYNPLFRSDRFIDGTYLSYWDENKGDFAGKDEYPGSVKPDSYFNDDEIHLRIYKNIHNYELAFYGYSGFWKSPSSTDKTGKKIFTKMDSIGMSLRGGLGPGIGNLEMSYYLSKEDSSGDKSEIKNSELRYLAGFSFDPAADLNINVQYYIEQLCGYGNYKENMPPQNIRDHFRRLVTISVTRSWMNQNLKLIFSGYYSTSDEDLYFRPKTSYQISDSLIAEAGANIFAGKNNTSFFGQFEKNSNIYFALSAYF